MQIEGRRVGTPLGPGRVVGRSTYRPDWGVWVCPAYDPTLGWVLLADPRGPFVAVLLGGRVVSVLYDDVTWGPEPVWEGRGPTGPARRAEDRLPPSIWDKLKWLLGGGDVDL